MEYPFFVVPSRTLAPSFANDFTARQDANTLSIQREEAQNGQTGANDAVVTYKLDGSESANLEGPMARTISTATWQDKGLSIVTRLVESDAFPRPTVKRMVNLDSNGRLLVATQRENEPPYITVYRRR